MAPIKSSLARSVSRLLGVQKDTDLSLRGHVQSNRFTATPTVASGGTKFTSGDQTYHLFHANSTLVMADDGGLDLTAEIFLVAGGGSGVDGGGGAGGIRNVPGVTLSAGETVLLEPSYPIVLESTGDQLVVGTGNYTGIAATHINFMVNGDKEV